MGGSVALSSGPALRRADYHGTLTVYVAVAVLVAASGGLMFGYDIGVTGGVTAMEPFLQHFFPFVLRADATSPQTLYCRYSSVSLQLFTSSFFLAGALTALIAAHINTSWGRKPTMVLGALTFLAGAAMCSAAMQLWQIILGRVLLGGGVGLANQAVPLFISELAPFKLRGALNMMFQLAITFSIVAAQLVNSATQHLLPGGWRLSLALAVTPALVLLLGCLAVPETPNALVAQNKLEAGMRVLQRIRGTHQVEAEFADICEAAKAATALSSSWRTLLQRRYRPQLVLCLLIPAFQQLTGINAVMFYAPQLFASLGSSSNLALGCTIITGAINAVATTTFHLWS